MIMPDQRKTVSIILSRMKPGGREVQGEAKPEEIMGDESDAPLKAIAEDMLIAFQSKSSQDLMTALKAFIQEYQNQDMDRGDG